jgi:hypothetical protein
VLVFLKRSESMPGYVTVGLSYGAKRLNDREIEVYSARIRELIEIEKETDLNTLRRRVVEWLVCCAEEPATRWEGAWDLLDSHEMKMEIENERKKAKGDQEGAVDEDEMEEWKKDFVDLTTLLTEEQKGRLTAALYRASSLSSRDMDLIRLVVMWGDDNLVPFMWSYLKASKTDSHWETSRLMYKLATLLKNQEASELVEKFDKVLYSNSIEEVQREQEKKAILRQFIESIERSGAPLTVKINNKS